jgi:hypothetical protein
MDEGTCSRSQGALEEQDARRQNLENDEADGGRNPPKGVEPGHCHRPSSVARSRELSQSHGASTMRTFIIVLVSALFATSALAQSACETQAVGKDGKPLSGAAKTAFVKKCKKDACEPKAVSSDGKPLSGAAKNSFMKKCQTDA